MIATPTHLLTQEATITPGAVTVATTGSPSVANATGSIVVACMKQGDASRESLQWQRDGVEVPAVLYLAPETTAGVALTFADAQWNTATVVISGSATVWKFVGVPVDLCDNGCLLRAGIVRFA